MLSEIMNKIASQEIAPAITVKDVAFYLNVDEKTIYRLAQKGELPGFKVAGSWRFELADIKKWIDGRKMKASNIKKIDNSKATLVESKHDQPFKRNAL